MERRKRQTSGRNARFTKTGETEIKEVDDKMPQIVVAFMFSSFFFFFMHLIVVVTLFTICLLCVTS